VKKLIIAAFFAVVSMLGIPGLDAMQFSIPNYTDLQKLDGIAFFDESKEYKRGLPLGLSVKGEKIFFTCRVVSSASQDCVPRKQRYLLDGKHVSVLWSEQPIFIFGREKRAFQIEVEGATFLAFEQLSSKYKAEKRDYVNIGTTVIISILITFGLVAFVLRKKIQVKNK
jgi:hypothetical protein